MDGRYQIVELTSGLDLSRDNPHDLSLGYGPHDPDLDLKLKFIDRPVRRSAALLRISADAPLYVRGKISFKELMSRGSNKGVDPIAGV